MDTVNLQVIREAFGRVVYSHKTHEKECELLHMTVWKIKWVNIILSCMTFGGVVSIFFTDSSTLENVTIFISTITLGFMIYQLSFNPEELAAKHRQVAKELWFIREKYENLIADIASKSLNSEQIRNRRDRLLEEVGVIYKFAPQTSTKAYKDAQKALKIDEELTFSDTEINQFLPKTLRSNKVK